MSEFAENLKQFRLKEGISQRTLATDIGVSQGAIKSWELDESIPSAKAVINIAEYFGITTDELLGVDKINPGQSIATGFGLDAEEQHVIDLYHKLDPQRQKNIIATMEVFVESAELGAKKNNNIG